ncbi:MAG: citrate transporter [Clostridiales bacterium]|nr:citrate transporter [Clostridiales bacterium]
MLRRIICFLKHETVFTVSALIALITACFVLPDREYWGYIDFKVLALLLSLMAVVAGLKGCGAFRALSGFLLCRCKNGRVLALILVMLPFFTSMLITNDVALLTFVPFTVMLLDEIGQEKALIPLLVLETVAANLGSMATPVGNPQNLYLYSAYAMEAGEFFGAVLPLTAASFLLLLGSALFVLPKALPMPEIKQETISDRRKLWVYTALFLLCLLVVFRVLHFGFALLAVLIALFVLDRPLLRELDYMLLLTFVCFFIVSGNLGRIEPVKAFLASLLEKNTLLTAVGASQVISNVPAAVLLRTFTEDVRGLLMGVNIGGLGTPIASLASLITLKLYLAAPGAKGGKFLALFTAVNAAGLLLLLLLAAVL